jgi:hypothetical protein
MSGRPPAKAFIGPNKAQKATLSSNGGKFQLPDADRSTRFMAVVHGSAVSLLRVV